MRVWQALWSWLNEIVPADSVAGNTLIGMLTRLTLRNPFHVALAATVTSFINTHGAPPPCAAVAYAPDLGPGTFCLVRVTTWGPTPHAPPSLTLRILGRALSA